MPKILFLAPCAPTNGVMLQPPKTPAEIYDTETIVMKVYESIKRLNYDFFSTHDVNHLIEHHDEYDLVWPLHFDGLIPLCEYYGVKYIGAAAHIHTLCTDKQMSRLVARQLGIKNSKWIVAAGDFNLPKTSPFPGPYFVKPRYGAVSIGIDETSLCETWLDVQNKSAQFFAKGMQIIIEEFIDGIEYGVPVFNSVDKEPITLFPLSRISEKKGIFTHSQKVATEGGLIRDLCRDEYMAKVLQQYARKYFLATQPCDYTRLDFIQERTSGELYFLEANSNMSFGIHAGIILSLHNSCFQTYDDVIRHVIEYGLAKP